MSDAEGNEVFTSTLPDEELKAEVEQKIADFPDVMPYFWQQEADYRELKERCAAQMVSGGSRPPHPTPTPTLSLPLPLHLPLTRYAPQLISGEATGTMCLTEPQCGSDLGQVTTRAEQSYP